MLAANEFIDNYGGGEQCVDFKEVKCYDIISGKPRITRLGKDAALRLGNGDSVAFELAPSPNRELITEVRLMATKDVNTWLNLLIDDPEKPLTGCVISKGVVKPVVNSDLIINDFIKEAVFKEGVIELRLTVNPRKGTISCSVNGDEVLRGKLSKPLSLNRALAKVLNIPALLIRSCGNACVNILRVCSNELRVWFDDKYYVRFTRTLMDLANKYGVRITWGVVTRGYKRREFFKPVKETLELIINNPQHEYASHTSHHLHAPPPLTKRVAKKVLGREPVEGYRDARDVANGIEDLNKVLSRLNRKVVTHIYPYGEESPVDWRVMKQYGVSVGLDTCEKLRDLSDISDWRLVCRTGKIDRSTVIDDVIEEIKKIKEAEGVALYMTHAHTFDWDSSESMTTSLEKLFRFISNDGEAWITTAGELYRYVASSSNVRIQGNGDSWIVRGGGEPVTLRFRLEGVSKVKVFKNSCELSEGLCRSLSECEEHYRLINNYLYVTVRPNGECVLRIEEVSP